MLTMVQEGEVDCLSDLRSRSEADFLPTSRAGMNCGGNCARLSNNTAPTRCPIPLDSRLSNIVPALFVYRTPLGTPIRLARESKPGTLCENRPWTRQPHGRFL